MVLTDSGLHQRLLLSQGDFEQEDPGVLEEQFYH
jgi:hypothetical protein